MGTRTAIFKQQTDGTYKGVYVHWDGYIEGVGYTLHKYYQNPDKTAQLIDRQKHLSSLGVNTTFSQLDYTDKEPCLADGEMLNTVGSSLTEYYVAKTLEAVRRFDYYTFGENDGIEGYLKDDGTFVAFKGSDNNGYLYAQTLEGEWLVSYMEDDDGKMSEFEPLADHFGDMEAEYKKRCDRYAEYLKTMEEY